MVKRRVLVLGAGGFIGRRVVEALRNTPWATPIAAFHRKPDGAPAECIGLEATDPAAVAVALAGTDAVVNCVAGSASTIAEGARCLLGAAASAGKPRIVHMSSMAVYGSATGAVDESASLRSDLGDYAKAKIEAERLAAGYPDVVILRPGCVYGPDSPQWSGRIAEWLLAGRIGDLGAAGDGLCNLVHVDDVVAATMAALQLPGPVSETFNLALPDPPTWNEYFIRYAKALGAVPVRRISGRRLKLETKLIAPPLKIAEILLRKAKLGSMGLPQPIPPSLLGLWQQEIRLIVRRAEERLGMRWKNLDEGLRESAAWYLGTQAGRRSKTVSPNAAAPAR